MGSFVFPTASVKARTEASARIKQAWNFAHHNLKGPRNTTTLYLGNLDYNASDEDIAKVLVPIFSPACSVDNITIPRVNCRSLYGFIDVSWVNGVPMQDSDFCTRCNSGESQVNGWPIYFRPLRDNDGSQ
jgi:hypothetical protein